MRRSPPVRMNRSGSGSPASCSAAPNASSLMSAGRSAPLAHRCASCRAAFTMSQRPPYPMATCRHSRAFAAVRSSAALMRACSRTGKPWRSPMNSRRTPLSFSSSSSPSSASMNSPISAETSSPGRPQFSLLNANRVSAPMPWRRHSRTHMRTGSTPSLWPAWRGSPRAAAQRPLPSMMIATWRGSVMLGNPGLRRSGSRSDRQDFLFLHRQLLVDVGDGLVGELLDLILGAALVVLGDQLLLQRFLHLGQHVAAHVAHADAGVLGILAHHLQDVLAALLGE